MAPTPLKTHHCCQRCNIFQPSRHFPFFLLEKLSADLFYPWPISPWNTLLASWVHVFLAFLFLAYKPTLPQSPLFKAFLPYDFSTLKFLRLWFWCFFLCFNFFLSNFIHSLGFSIIAVVISWPMRSTCELHRLISNWTSYWLLKLSTVELQLSQSWLGSSLSGCSLCSCSGQNVGKH